MPILDDMEQSVDEALEKADVNNDGYITWFEYMDAVHKNEHTTEHPPEHHENEHNPNELNQNDHITTTSYDPAVIIE